MSPTPRDVAASFFRFLDARQLSSLFDLASPTATWWILGRPELGATWGGTQTFAERRPLVEGLMRQYAKFSFTVLSMTVEGEKVVAEGKVEAQHENETQYRNDVVMAFTVREGKIQTLREYIDVKVLEEFVAAVSKA